MCWLSIPEFGNETMVWIQMHRFGFNVEKKEEGEAQFELDRAARRS
jgi:hypothetical protein